MQIESLDLHGHTVSEAMSLFVRRYNRLLSSMAVGELRGLEVIHGKGKGGEIGLIREALRDYLRQQGKRISGFDAQLAMRGASYAAEQGGKLSYIYGEDVSGNAGCTIVIPRQRLTLPRGWYSY
jgi:hypothetical protein